MRTSVAELKEIVHEIRERYNLTPKQILELAEQRTMTFIPLYIFSDRKLGILETVVKYLKEELAMSFKEIGGSIARDNKMVWTVYDNAIKKQPYRLPEKSPRYLIPLEIFKDKTYGPLTSLVIYCREELGLDNSAISKLINRDTRTLWAVYDKARGKRR